jgi:uncharacterized tellurite resistance protein B-like protein
MSRHALIADVLMGAAHADKQLDGREVEKIKALLCNMLHVTTLPAELEARIAKFKLAQFDVAATCTKLGFKTDEEKRYMLELIAAVHDSDEVWDFDEDQYLRRVAVALGLSEDKWGDLAVQNLSIEAIGEALFEDEPTRHQ